MSKSMLLKCLLLSMSYGILSSKGYAQDANERANRYQQLADSLAETKQFKRTAQLYLNESVLRKMIPYKKQALVNAGYHYAMAGMTDSAFYCFNASIRKYGFENLSWLDSESALTDVRKLAEYKQLRQYLLDKEEESRDPEKAKFITSDIKLFWEVYDRYKSDTSRANERFLSEYFEQGSASLQEYFREKTPNIRGLNGFVNNVKKMPAFYGAIRENTLKVGTLEDTVRIIYRNLKSIYEPSVFPATTFVIGGWSSGGTVTIYGSILGADMQSADANTPVTELNAWQRRNLIRFDGMKHVVAHELIHIQQSHMASDTILLRYAIVEGMADFLGELISGKTAIEGLHVWAKGREKAVWEAFKKEMFLDRYSNWIGNSSQETPDHPADLGYWVGYQICKAYYDENPDKKQAVWDMLHIQDYRAFLQRSKLDEKISRQE